MNHWYSSMGAGDWLIMSLFWVVLVGAVAWAIVHLTSRGGAADSRSEQPDAILDRRLASGEIDPATYDTLRGKLHETHSGRA